MSENSLVANRERTRPDLEVQQGEPFSTTLRRTEWIPAGSTESPEQLADRDSRPPTRTIHGPDTVAKIFYGYPDPLPEELEAKKGQAIVLGVCTVGSDRYRFRPCGYRQHASEHACTQSYCNSVTFECRFF